VTRSASRGIATAFRQDPYGVVVRVIREADAAVTATQVKQTLTAQGIATLDKRAWDRLQRRLRWDEHVVVEPGYRYRWVAQASAPAPIDAFSAIVRAAGSRARPSDVAAVEDAIGKEPSEDSPASQRQIRIDGLRALAELASEVEELLAAEASVRALVHRVRSRVRLAGLHPLERAGETVPFDSQRHQSIGASVKAGKPVLVIRPGYLWRSSAEEFILAKAAVQE
jgi:hypothetical protein